MKRFIFAACVTLLVSAAAVNGAPASPPSGVPAEFAAQLDEAGKKLVQLAEAFPADKYGWRPAEGVRSVSEVFMHVAGANYGLPAQVGVDMPEGTGFGMEKTITAKADVVAALRKSFEHAKKALLGKSDAELGKPVKLFGHDTTVRGTFLIVVDHAHEHLGQAIAYARMNGVVPPWSAKEK